MSFKACYLLLKSVSASYTLSLDPEIFMGELKLVCPDNNWLWPACTCMTMTPLQYV